MSTHEQLSRLLAGELPPAEAEALRRRIVEDPALRAEWESLQSVVAELESLPLEVPPPAALDAVVLGEPVARGRRAVGWLPMVAALAAILLGWLVASREPSEVVLLAGSQWVSGAAVVQAGDVRVDVDGVARIEVEPPADRSRVPGAKEDPMRKDAVVAGLAGAIVTVTVYEGSALVRPADASAPIEVRAGEMRSVGAPRVVRRAAPDAEPAPAEGESDAETIARLERELADTRQRLAEAEFVGALTRGQLAAHRGDPVPWPDEVPVAFGPDGFEQALRDLFAELPEVVVETVDCSEYPCLAAVRSWSEDLAWYDDVEGGLRGMMDESFGDEAAAAMQRFEMRTDGGDARYIVFGAWDGEGRGIPEELRKRTDFRMDQIVDDIGSRVQDEVGDR